MHDIITKNNREHLEVMGYLSSTHDLNPTYQYCDFVVISFEWKIKLSPRGPLCILIQFEDVIALTIVNNINQA